MNQRKIVYKRVIQLIKIRKQQLDLFDKLMKEFSLNGEFETKLKKAQEDLEKYTQTVSKINVSNDNHFEKLIRIYSIMLGLAYGIASKT